MEKNMKILAVILAGGRSSRMGTPKSLLQIQGVPLVDKITATLAQLKPLIGAVVISGSVPGKKGIEDHTPYSGPVEGIKCVAERYLGKADALLIVPVDLPMLDADTLRPLIKAIQKADDAALSFNGHPLPAVFRLNERLLDLCRTHTSVKGILKDLGAKPIDLINPLALTNTNTPEEWVKTTGEIL